MTIPRDQSYHLVLIPVRLDRLARWAVSRRLPHRDPDEGYILHLLWTRLFGTASPSQFSIGSNRGRYLEVLAYSLASADELHEEARLHSDPNEYAIVDWDACASKRMPERWPAGLELWFRVRACPVVRSSSDTRFYRKGSEVDAFLAQCTRESSDGVQRFETYCEWLRRMLERSGAVTPLGISVTRFRLVRLWRNPHSESASQVRIVGYRPDVTFEGTLRVETPEAFDGLLRRGIGRHRAFGFGMLHLHRVYHR